MTAEPNFTYTVLGAYVEQLELKKQEIAFLERRVRQLEKKVAAYEKDDEKEPGEDGPLDINEV